MRVWSRSVRALLVLLGLLATFALAVPIAQATNAGSQSGDDSTGCDVLWNARSVLDLDLNNEQDGGGLAVDRNNEPVDYSNGGYLTEVRPEYGDGGLFELNHWYTPASTPSAAGAVQAWRVPIATDHTILGASVSVVLPDTMTSVTADGSATNARIAIWGDPYSDYTWSDLPASAITIDGTRATISLGDLPAGHGYVVTFLGQVPVGTDLTQPVYADAQLTGRLVQGATDACPVTVPPTPEVPEHEVCQQALAGQTVFPLLNTDIRDRTKVGDGGEVNADGWGAASGVGQGATRMLRLYGATDVALENVTFTATAAQGFTFAPTLGKVVTANPKGMGALYANGYTEAVTFTNPPVVSADGRTITFTLDSMPANSAFAFGATAVLDGSGQAVVVNETLVGDLEECLGSISGHVFEDADRSATITSGDSPVPTYVVTLHLPDGSTLTTTTDADGYYEFPDLPPGEYTVTIEVVDPWTEATTPISSGTIDLGRGEHVTDVDFGLITAPAPQPGESSPPPSPSPTPTPSTSGPSTSGPSTPTPTATPPSGGGTLAQTGGDLSLLAAIGAALLALGVATMVASRRGMGSGSGGRAH